MRPLLPSQDFLYAPPQEALNVLFQDDDILVVSKPSGLLSVPGRPKDHWDCAEFRARKLVPTARAVHRLDLRTSGLLVFGLTPLAVRDLGRQFETRLVKKNYIARVWGEIKEDAGVVEEPLICDWLNKPLQKIDHEIGKPARTAWQVLEREVGATRLSLDPLTGRSHQLRVHLMSIGHPILGDEFYAHEDAFLAADRLQLHAFKLSFRHPFSGETLQFTDECLF